MSRKAASTTFVLAAVLLAGAAVLTARAVTFNLSDGTNSISCPASGNATIDASGNISATVQSGCIPTSGGGGGGTGPWTLSLTVSGTAGSTVTSDVGGISCGVGNTGTCSNNSITDGTVVTLTANPATSTTVSWGGACAGNSLTCVVNVTGGNKSVTASFSSSGGGGGGSDPGTGLWINGSNYVHDRGSLSELFVPRCVPNQYNNCRLGGSQSQYDTLLTGQTWSMRIPAGGPLGAQTYSFGVQRAETGESVTTYDFAISATAGDFNVASSCKLSGAGTIAVYDPSKYKLPFGVTACSITPNTKYYLNVKAPSGATCSAGSPCRYRITLPTGFPYSP